MHGVCGSVCGKVCVCVRKMMHCPSVYQTLEHHRGQLDAHSLDWCAVFATEFPPNLILGYITARSKFQIRCVLFMYNILYYYSCWYSVNFSSTSLSLLDPRQVELEH